MADQNASSVRQRIISSVFSRRNATGTLEETYVSHVKIWEDAGSEDGGRKPRYILLSEANNGTGFIHKSKLNTNGSFSVGKTWRLAELRAIQVVNPLSFNITLARTYKWQTESPSDQEAFLMALIRLFRTVTRGSITLQLHGISDPDIPPGFTFGTSAGRQPIQSDYMRLPRAPSPTSNPPTSPRRSRADSRPQTSPRTDRESDRSGRLPSSSQSVSLRTGLSSRNASPSKLSFPLSSSLPRDQSTSRPSVPASPDSYPSTLRPRQGRRISNATSTSSQIPSINLSTTTSSRPNDQQNLPSNENLSARAATDYSITPTSLYSAVPLSRSRPPSPGQTMVISPREDNKPIASEPQQIRREINPRVSFFDPANQATLDRLIAGDGSSVDLEGEDESTQATLASVEEMLEGYEWASDDVIGRKSAGGAADLIEARLLDELTALDKANIYSFLESDDRIALVLKFMDDALAELDNMDSLISSYKIHLNAVSDDISYIQSQKRGLQVQTQNQRALLSELENLLQTVHVDRDALITLTQESLEKATSIERLEMAATELYKALQAGRETDMAATMERLEEYRTHNSQFCKRLFDYLSIMFTAQSKLLLDDNNGITKTDGRQRPAIVDHQNIEAYLGRYAGLMLYLKEMDETIYGKLCAAYFSAASELHSTQVKSLLSVYAGYVKKASDEDPENSGITPTGGKTSAGMRRAGTLIRSPLEGRHRDRDKNSDGTLRASEAFGLILEQVIPQIHREDDFIADFLQINDAALTFADYMNLDNYFRRQAARSAGLSPATMKLVRGALDLIFGFLPTELKTWLDNALAKDNMEVIGILACLERSSADASDRSNPFLPGLLEKQHIRLKGLFDRHINDHIKGIEQTKLTSKKRRGVAPFVKQFPVYIRRVENQLIGSDDLKIRRHVDEAYDRIVQTMFESLKHMAKMDGEGEDKGQLNYHVILIENMHHFIAETSQLEISSVTAFSRRAESIYEDNLNAYVKIVLRRPFAKIIDYFEGIERLLKTTTPSEVANNSNYNRSALKKVIKEYNSKDIRKHVDALFKRVEKHFTEASEKTTTEESSGIPPGTVMVGVWKACEDELLRITELFSKRISQCYSDSGLSLEYTSADVEAAFRRHTAEI